MQKERPLSERIYFDACYTDIVRTVGYAGMTYREWNVKLQELIQHHGRQAESAAYHLLTFEGQMRINPSPLAKVELRAEVRKLAAQLLGLPPEYPLYYFLKHGPAHLMGEDAYRWEAEYRAKLEAGRSPQETPQPVPPKEESAPEPAAEPTKEKPQPKKRSRKKAG